MRPYAALLCLTSLASLGGVAHAEAVRVPATGGAVPHVLYIDRCPMDCAISAGAADDARTDTSGVLVTDAVLTRMPRLDLVWADIVLCLGQVFGPYDLAIATEEPDPGTDYIEIKVAGSATEIEGFFGGPGLGPIAEDCSPLDHALGIAFTNQHDLITFPTEGAAAICAAVAHQAGHMLGLEHTDQCHDLMGASATCASRRWFTDYDALGVESTCRAVQSSHDELLTLLGEGAEQPPPRVDVRSPRDNAAADEGFAVDALVFEGRPLARVELYIDDPFYDQPVDVIVDDVDVDVVTGTGRYTLHHATGGLYGYARVDVLAFDDLGRVGGDGIGVIVQPGGCATGRGGAAPWLGLLAIARLLSRRRRRS